MDSIERAMQSPYTKIFGTTQETESRRRERPARDADYEDKLTTRGDRAWRVARFLKDQKLASQHGRSSTGSETGTPQKNRPLEDVKPFRPIPLTEHYEQRLQLVTNASAKVVKEPPKEPQLARKSEDLVKKRSSTAAEQMKKADVVKPLVESQPARKSEDVVEKNFPTAIKPVKKVEQIEEQKFEPVEDSVPVDLNEGGEDWEVVGGIEDDGDWSLIHGL